MIYHPPDCDVHFGPCPTGEEVDELRAQFAVIKNAPTPPPAHDESGVDEP